MNNLLIVKETITNGYRVSILDIIAVLAIFCGIFVIINKNPIVSVLFLIGLFASISSYLLMLGLNFIGLSYLIVYIGAVSILFLFILMLINIRISELQSNTRNSIPLGIIIGIIFNYLLFQLLPYTIKILNNNFYLNSIIYTIYNFFIGDSLRSKKNNFDSFNPDIFYVADKTWDGNLVDSSHIASIGNIMYTNYNVWLLIASFILLLAMVGAIVITIKQRV